MNTALKKIKSLLQKAPKTQVITFVLITSFLMTMSPISIFGASPTPTSTSSSASSNQPSSYRTWLDGGLEDLASGGASLITGYKKWDQDVTVSSDGTIQSPTATYEGGAMQEIGNLSEFFYANQPASFIVWAQDQYYQAQGAMSLSVSAADVNPNDTSSYVPGNGYTILQPVLGLWQMSANIVYAVLMIILIVIAFLILLRQPLGGKEIVTIANSIPSIITTLVLVVFSYALCGLFIDAIYLGSNVAYNMLIGGQNSPGAGLSDQVAVVDSYGKTIDKETDIKNILQPDDPQMSIWTIFKISGGSVCNRVGALGEVTGADGVNKCAFSYIVPATFQSNGLGVAIDYLVNALSEINITNGLIELIIALAVFQTSIKLFLGLLNSYLTLSFYPIIAPFVFLQGALPGGTMKALDQFFKTLGAAALNFIVIYACFLLLVVFGHTAVDSNTQIGSSFSQAGQVKWTPPLLGYSQKQIFDTTTLNNNGRNIITSLLIFGLYMAMPNVMEMIKEFMKVSSPFAQLSATTKDMSKVGKEALGYIGEGAKKVLGGNFFGG